MMGWSVLPPTQDHPKYRLVRLTNGKHRLYRHAKKELLSLIDGQIHKLRKRRKELVAKTKREWMNEGGTTTGNLF